MTTTQRIFTTIVITTLVQLTTANAGHAAPPVINSFTASLDLSVNAEGSNKVDLSWNTSGGYWLAYIYEDIGFQPLNGSTSVFPSAGIRRYTLVVNNAALETTTKTIEIEIPALEPPQLTISDGGQSANPITIDMFAPPPLTLSWDDRPSFVLIKKPDGSNAINPSSDNEAFWSATSYDIDPNDLQLGNNIFTVRYCIVTDFTSFEEMEFLCSAPAQAIVYKGPSRFDGRFREVLTPGSDFTLTWGSTGHFWHISSPSLGIAQFVSGPTSFQLTNLPAGIHDITLVTCVLTSGGECSNAPNVGDPITDTKQLIVSSTQPSWTTRAWSDDFSSLNVHPSWKFGLHGLPLDTLIDSTNDIWSMGEFSQSIAHVDNGQMTSHEVPLLRVLQGSKFRKVAPFGGFGVAPTPITILGERIIESVGPNGERYIWFTQGGELLSKEPATNHSRIGRFYADGVDDPSTQDDDRFCMYNVPGSGNEVIGLAWDGNPDWLQTRIWFAESQPSATGSIAQGDIVTFPDGGITSFAPSELPCENFLDYSQAQPNSAHQYCQSGQTTGCFQRVGLPNSFGPSHLIYDQVNDAIWFTEFYGDSLGRYDIISDSIDRYPLPTSSRPGPISFLYASAIWQVRQDANYVYFSEWQDAGVARFDKSAPPNTCKTLDANGNNPCIDEIHIPLGSNDMFGHSIELSGNQLWFTLDNPVASSLERDGTLLGYIDTSSWQSGVLYTDVAADSGGIRHSVGPAGFTGISINSAGNRIVVNEFLRQQIIELVQ